MESTNYGLNLMAEAMKNLNDDHKILMSTGNMELTSMTLEPGKNIPKEEHDVDQFIYVVSGQADITIFHDGGDITYQAKAGGAIIIPVGVFHEVANNSNDRVHMFSIYTPPKDNHE